MTESTSSSRALVGRGARATEELLFAELRRLDQTHGPWSPPIRIVVPSGSLRTHLLAELARRQGARLGIEVVTLRRLALSIFERGGEPAPRGDALLPILVRREALGEPALSKPLAPLEGGFAPLVATVSDLLDAGLEAVHGRALDELLQAPGVRIAFADRPRAAAVARVASRVAQGLDRLGAAPGASLYRRAADRLAADPERLPPAGRWLVHGFADATGSALDLLDALARRAPATILIDLPISAAGAPRDDREPHGAPLRARLLEPRRAGETESLSAPVPTAELDAFSALGEHGEAREVARRIRVALAADPALAPERIGVVARSLEAHLDALRRAFDEAAIPFTADGAGGGDPRRRQAAALVHLLDRRGGAEAEGCLDLLEPARGPGSTTELRVALRLLGVVTADELAALGAGVTRDVPLPIRDLAAGDDGTARLGRRRVSAGEIRWWARRAGSLLEHVAAVPERATAERLVAGLAALARHLPTEGGAGLWLAQALARFASEVPADFRLGRDEAIEWLGRQVDALPPVPAGGCGGGVQVLPVSAARARTFDLLFVVGLRRGAFPRTAAEDPFLPDGVRREARALLPDLQVKSEAAAEERFLFDQLVSAAPRVVLSFAAIADDGTVQLPSPLLDRLSWRDDATRDLRERWRIPVPPERASDLPEPPAAMALRHGIGRDRDAWGTALAAARAEARERARIDAVDAAVARHRRALLEEVDPDPRSETGRRRWSALGPFFGRVAPVAEAPLFVTRVESLVRCAWLDYLNRVLGVEPLPDAAGALPEPLDPLRVGDATHRLLEELLGSGLAAPAPAEWTELAEPPPPVAFPPPEVAARRARELAGELLAEEGLARWGFERLLAEALIERVERARVDWDAGARRLVGVELAGRASLSVDDTPLAVEFRADRVERDGDRWILTDYKTGSAQRIAKLARGELGKAIAAGSSLQPVAYVAAFAGRAATGRLLALAPPDRDDDDGVAAVDESDAAALAALARAAAAAAAARAHGRFPPRLVDARGEQQGAACRLCELVEACVQEDSTARGRMARWAAARRLEPRPHPAEPAGAEALLFLLPEGGGEPA